VSVTNADKDEVAYYEYDAWGNTMTEAEIGDVDNPYRYSTKEWDEKSGLYYFGARYYSPEIGRWIRRDPLGTTESLNLYPYVMNSPTNSLDPYGRSIWDWFTRAKKMRDLYKKLNNAVWRSGHAKECHDLWEQIRGCGERDAIQSLCYGCCEELWGILSEIWKPSSAWEQAAKMQWLTTCTVSCYEKSWPMGLQEPRGGSSQNMLLFALTYALAAGSEGTMFPSFWRDRYYIWDPFSGTWTIWGGGGM